MGPMSAAQASKFTHATQSGRLPRSCPRARTLQGGGRASHSSTPSQVAFKLKGVEDHFLCHSLKVCADLGSQCWTNAAATACSFAASL